MSLKTHQVKQASDFKELDFTLWRLRREYEQRHQHEVNRLLNERPRERGEPLH